MNYIFISPNFPKTYAHFVSELKNAGVSVFGIGDEPYISLSDELKSSLTEYCFVSDMNRVDWMINTINYLQNKYGPIDFIESNNEYWLKNDAIYREWFNIPNGFRPADLAVKQAKSTMKKFFKRAGVKTARYIMVSSFKKSLAFIDEVGYPVFAKPDQGVGASDTYKIKNINDLKAFHSKELSEPYIMEEYLDGFITSFDGIADAKSKVAICFNETFPAPIAEIVQKNRDVYYYAKSKMDPEFYTIGCKVVKAFKLQQRCFHIEFFVLTKDKEGFGKKGDVVALEANLRSPGGNTSDLLNLTSNISYYKTYADVIMGNKVCPVFESNRIAVSVNRKKEIQYAHTDYEINQLFGSHIVEHGTYPEAFRQAMGDEYYFATFTNEKDMKAFVKFVRLRK